MSSSNHATDLKIIPLKDIQESTNNFAAENLIGEGGFGKVYKGKLFWSEELIDIAARKLHRDYGQGDLEFWHEISMLSNLEHANLVSFIGYCDEKGVKIIVSKYEANESLDKYIKDPKLTWTQRLQICVKIARALSYLQDGEGHDSSVIHRNIKSSKILLDQNWEPKLSGFGVSMKNTRARKNRLLLAEVVGTLGYVDPTYEKTGFVTHKSDVYSFGVLMFEILCGRKAFVPYDLREEDSPQFLVEKSFSTNAMVPIKSKAGQPSMANMEHTEQMEYGSQPTSISEGQSPPFSGGQPTSFCGGQPLSFANSLPRSFGAQMGHPTSSDDSDQVSQPPSLTGLRPVASDDSQPPSLTGLRPVPFEYSSQRGHPTSSDDSQPPSLTGLKQVASDDSQPPSLTGLKQVLFESAEFLHLEFAESSYSAFSSLCLRGKERKC